jgi:molecular chaperone DnaJ
VLTSKRVSVRIPAGVDTGSRLRLSGEGEPGAGGGPSGDLYVFIHVEPHDFFQRDGDNVICQIPISFVQATLGDEITVKTLDGEASLKVPKGTQFGDVLRLPDKGIPSLRTGQRGEQIVQLLIKTPTSLSKKQEQLLREFAKLEGKKISTKLKGILKNAAQRTLN